MQDSTIRHDTHNLMVNPSLLCLYKRQNGRGDEMAAELTLIYM